VEERGKSSWGEVVQRCRNYGVSDSEVFANGSRSGWSARRKAQSVLHPLKVDLALPLVRLGPARGIRTAPFLAAFTSMRYFYWARAAVMNDPS